MTIGRAIAHRGRVTWAGGRARRRGDRGRRAGRQRTVPGVGADATQLDRDASIGDLDLALALVSRRSRSPPGSTDSHWGGLAACYLAAACLDAGEDAERCRALPRANTTCR